MTRDRVSALLEDLRSANVEQHELVQALRAQALALDASIREEVKYGGLLFSTDKSLCGIFAYAQHVSLEFSHGAALPDTHKVLEGAGKGRRHIKLRSMQDLADKQVADYLALAFQYHLTS